SPTHCDTNGSVHERVRQPRNTMANAPEQSFLSRRSMVKALWSILLVAGVALSLIAAEDPPSNPLYRELLETGFTIPNGPTVKLPPPLVKEGMNAAALKAV